MNKSLVALLLVSTIPLTSIANDEKRYESKLGCAIKGNIAKDGEKIYHLPGQKYYAVTKINRGNGERYFCTESEAQKSGWRKSKI